MKKLISAAGFVAAGAACLVLIGSNFASKTVREQLGAQHIKFPPKAQLESENKSLVKYADAEVDTGDEAKAYSEYIKGHLAKVAGGKTYSEISGAYQKDRTNKDLESQRMALFMGETLRGLLLNAWGWGLVGKIAMYASYALLLIAAVLLVLAIKPSKLVKKSTKGKKDSKK